MQRENRMKSIFKDERWGILQEEKEQGKAITYIFEKNGLKIIYPFIKRKAGIVGGAQYFDIVTPRGRCGPYIDGDETLCTEEIIAAFDAAFNQYCQKELIVAEYVQFCPFENQSHYFSSIYNLIKYNGQIYCNDLTIDFFNLEYSKKTRQHIRSAEGNGVEVVIDPTPASIDTFLTLYKFTESKHHASEYYRFDKHYLERHFEIMPENIFFANAIYENKTIISCFHILGEDVVLAAFIGIDPNYLFLRAQDLVLYKAALYGAEKGRKRYDMDRAGDGTSLAAYKEKHVAKSNKKYPYDLGTKIRNQEIYDALVMQAGGPREGYFPAYRR